METSALKRHRRTGGLFSLPYKVTSRPKLSHFSPGAFTSDAQRIPTAAMTFSVGPVVEVAHLNAEARVASLGGGAVVLVQSDQLPEQFVSTRAGSGIIGLSIEVADLTNVAEHTDIGSTDVESLFGSARLFPLVDRIGLFVEFHQR